MRRTERVACIPVCVGHLKEREPEDRVTAEKIVLRHPDKIGFEGVIRINKDQDRTAGGLL
jgi:hypothetical protein